MSHGDRVTALPRGFAVVGTSENAPFAAIADEARQVLRHPVPPRGRPHAGRREAPRELRPQHRRAAPATGRWPRSATQAIARIREQVGKGRVICGLSGGVDSAVAAVLIHEAIGDQLTCVFVDHGLLRQGEAERGRRALPRPLQHPAGPRRRERDRSSPRSPASADPEAKRKTIGRLFIDVFDAEAQKVGGADFLAQGTLYPDVIESVSPLGGPSVTIKSHHNVGGLPERMKMKLVEPLRELFKDEVRGARPRARPAGGLRRPPPVPGPRPRHPLPGRGHAARSSTSCARPTRSISTRSARPASTTRSGRPSPCSCRCRRSASWATAAPTTSCCALRAVTSTDGMTADFYPFDMAFLGRAATRIINEVKGINRVVYDVTSKPPGTIEWE